MSSSKNNKYCDLYNYANEKQQHKDKVIKDNAIVEEWVNTKVNGKQQYRNSIIINFIAEEGKAIPEILSVDMLKAMQSEHDKLIVEENVAYRKSYQFPEPMEQVDEDETTTVTIGAKYTPIRKGFRSSLSFG
tara:strand:- start:42 stop:437 length:396 start_codon:yes stop_codon:yes gene_type:complete